jgi:hypothetical protein
MLWICPSGVVRPWLFGYTVDITFGLCAPSLTVQDFIQDSRVLVNFRGLAASGYARLVGVNASIASVLMVSVDDSAAGVHQGYWLDDAANSMVWTPPSSRLRLLAHAEVEQQQDWSRSLTFGTRHCINITLRMGSDDCRDSTLIRRYSTEQIDEAVGGTLLEGFIERYSAFSMSANDITIAAVSSVSAANGGVLPSACDVSSSASPAPASSAAHERFVPVVPWLSFAILLFTLLH